MKRRVTGIKAKRRFAKLIPLLLTVTVIIGLVAPTASAAAWLPPATNLPFNDVPQGAWFRNYVGWAFANNITTGTSPTTFAPNANVTRGQFVTFLYRIAGTPAVSGSHGFHDVPAGEFFATPVLWAAQTGVTTGTTPTTFSPDAPITREQLVTMLHRYIGDLGLYTTTPANALDMFIDSGSVSSWAIAAMRWGAHNGIIGTGGTLNPRGNASRADTVAMLQRVVNTFNIPRIPPANQPGQPPTQPPPVLIPVTGVNISLDKSPAQLKINETSAVIINILPFNATDQSVQLSVDNASILSITQDGHVTGLARGTATITATASNGLSRNLSVTVSPSSITLPNRRATNAERQAWISDYTANGGPTATELEVIRLVNIERENNGLVPVSMDISLMQAARYFGQQAYDLREYHTVWRGGNDGHSHNFGPYATNPVASHGASRNVAVAFGNTLGTSNRWWNGGNWYGGGSLTAGFMVTGWMNSQGHRDLILSPGERFIGVGQYPGGISYMYMSAVPSN
jgi:uncharacterized protein YkwD